MSKSKKSPDGMTFLEHLDDLRKRLFHSFLAIVFTIFPAWFFHEQIFDILAKPINQYLPEGESLVVTRLPEAFVVYIKVSFLAALFVASPYIFFQFWKFVAPGLYQKERKYVIPFIFFTTVFFAAGGAFGYFVVFPFAVRFFINLSANFELVFKADEYLSLALHVLVGIALVFELPTLVFFLSRMGLITAKWMAKRFKYAVLVVFIIAAIITPTPDPFIQSVVAIPMLALYGFGMLIAFLSEKRRKEKAKESDSEEDLAG